MPGMEQPSVVMGPVFMDWSSVDVPLPFAGPLDPVTPQSVYTGKATLAPFYHHVRGFARVWCADNNPVGTMLHCSVNEVDMTSSTQFAGTTDSYSITFNIQPWPDTPWPRFIIDRGEVTTTHWEEATIGEVEQ